jgi:hypothetical protein
MSSSLALSFDMTDYLILIKSTMAEKKRPRIQEITYLFSQLLLILEADSQNLRICYLHSILRQDLNKKSEIGEITFLKILEILFFKFSKMLFF